MFLAEKINWNVLLLLPIALMGQEDSIFCGTQHQIFSEILKEQRSYQVSLPDSYLADEFYHHKSYPVMIVLDGGIHFLAVSNLVKSMTSTINGNERIPEMIVVGISNLAGTRNRDFTPSKTKLGPNGQEQEALANSGGSDQFMAFLEKELLPEINRNYRTLDFKMLIGHSLGGLFALNALLNQRDFNAYLAIDPSLWWEEQFIIKKAASVSKTNELAKARLYLSKSNNPFNADPTISANEKAIQDLLANLKQLPKNKLNFQYQFFEQEDHFSITMISIYHGLLFIFEGYNFRLNQYKTLGEKGLVQHYENFNHQMGAKILPPGKWLDFVGNYLARKGALDFAIKIFEFCINHYPDSFVPYRSLALAYLRKEDSKMALLNFQKALELAPENQAILTRINEITQMKKEKE